MDTTKDTTRTSTPSVFEEAYALLSNPIELKKALEQEPEFVADVAAAATTVRSAIAYFFQEHEEFIRKAVRFVAAAAEGFMEVVLGDDFQLWRTNLDHRLALETALLDGRSWSTAARTFGLSNQQLSAFYYVVLEGNWRHAKDIKRYVFKATLKQWRLEQQPLLGPRARQPWERVELEEPNENGAVMSQEALLVQNGAELALYVNDTIRHLLRLADGDSDILELKLLGYSWTDLAGRNAWSRTEMGTIKKRFSRFWPKVGFKGEPTSAIELAEWEPVIKPSKA